MKRIAASALAFCLIFATAALAAPSLDTGMFDRAKNAVILISYGEYESAVNEISSADVIDPAGLEEYVGKKARSIYSGTIQKDYSVAWLDGDMWIVAVPFAVPDDDGVGCMTFASDDGFTAKTYKYMSWGDVKSGYLASDNVIWQEEYIEDTVMAFADDMG